ncbi:MAG: hypothetical protein JKY62_17065 [Desulfocapsa sp.]|nr:hypothetical protein [Desulfocapsa sp.]
MDKPTKVLVIGATYGMGHARLALKLQELGYTVIEAADAIRSFNGAISDLQPGLHTLKPGVLYIDDNFMHNPTQTNHPDGWYRKFEKPNGKRNKKL